MRNFRDRVLRLRRPGILPLELTSSCTTSVLRVLVAATHHLDTSPLRPVLVLKTSPSFLVCFSSSSSRQRHLSGGFVDAHRSPPRSSKQRPAGWDLRAQVPTCISSRASSNGQPAANRTDPRGRRHPREKSPVDLRSPTKPPFVLPSREHTETLLLITSSLTLRLFSRILTAMSTPSSENLEPAACEYGMILSNANYALS
mmetsp:Transcript_17775/g.54325  ORF Transcript_17775/g.54325 Transcript_17775/m.54325 type:complete len:200 (-) Transcript_17775:67-666(-)